MRQYLQRANVASSIFLAFLIGFLAAPAASAQAPAGPPGGPPQASSDVQIGFLFQPQVKVGADYASYELPQARLSFRGSLTEQTRFFTQVNLARQGRSEERRVGKEYGAQRRPEAEMIRAQG